MPVTAEKLSATKLARQYNTSVVEIQHQLIRLGYIEVRSGFHYFTDLGRSVGGEWRKNHPEASSIDGHMVWPADLHLADLPPAHTALNSMDTLLNQVAAAVQRIKAQFPDPADVGSCVLNDAIVTHQRAQVTARRAQAEGMAQLAQESAQSGEVTVARALAEWAEIVWTEAAAQERRMASPEYQEWLTGRQEWLAESAIE